MSDYTLLLPKDYAADLANVIDTAKERIDIIALVFYDDASTHEIIDALCRAGERGIHVSIGLDTYFTYKELTAQSSRWAYLREQLRRMRATRRKLESSGVKVRWLGLFGATFFSRRTHVKWSIIDSAVYAFGGVNLYQEGIDNTDYIIKTVSPKLAERLASEHDLVINTDKAGIGYPSHSFSIGKDVVYIDGGRIFDSIIYRRACALAKKSERIVYVSQYCPTGRLSRLLKKTNTTFYFNSWRNASDKLNALLILFGSKIHRIETSYTQKKYLHAKFMLFYTKHGETIALSGSHNFVASGGTLGTREIAFETKNPALIKQLETFLNQQIIGE